MAFALQSSPPMRTLSTILVSIVILAPTAQAAESLNLNPKSKAPKASAVSMSLQQALESNLGKVCSLHGQTYALDPDDEDACVEMGGKVQAASRNKMVQFRNSKVYQRAEPARRDGGRITVEPDHRHSDPLISPSSRDTIGPKVSSP